MTTRRASFDEHLYAVRVQSDTLQQAVNYTLRLIVEAWDADPTDRVMVKLAARVAGNVYGIPAAEIVAGVMGE
jgi:hypothetical protein